MMSYEGLEEARAKRAAKEKATVEKGGGKRGRKQMLEPVKAQRHGGSQWRECTRKVLLNLL